MSKCQKIRVFINVHPNSVKASLVLEVKKLTFFKISIFLAVN